MLPRTQQALWKHRCGLRGGVSLQCLILHPSPLLALPSALPPSPHHHVPVGRSHRRGTQDAPIEGGTPAQVPMGTGGAGEGWPGGSGTACRSGAGTGGRFVCRCTAPIAAPSALFCHKTCCLRNAQTDIEIYINIYVYFATKLFSELVSQSQAGVSRAQQCEVLEAVRLQAAAGRREGEVPGHVKAEQGATS